MDFLFGLDKSNPPLKDLELLTTVNERIYQAMIESVLSDNEIPYLSKERGSGAAVKVITGFSMFGTDIFVLKKDIERAKELLELLNAIPEDDAEYSGLLDDEV